jgi:glycopeptide antibiotics resistance protein
MNPPELAARCARITPKRTHVAFPLLMMALLYWLSSVPGMALPDDPKLYSLFFWVSPGLQNALHVPVYAALAWAWHWALGAWLRLTGSRILIACAASLLYGVFDEWHQSFVPGRFASLADVALNLAGTVLGIWIAVRTSRYAKHSAAVVVASNSRPD